MKLLVMTDIYIVIKTIDEIQEILIAERDKRNKLSIKYNRGVNMIGLIDNCLGVCRDLVRDKLELVFSQQSLPHQP